MTNTTTTPAIAGVAAIGGIFDNLWDSVKAAGVQLEQTAETDLKALFTQAKQTVTSTISIVAPTLESDLGVLKTAVEGAANLFTNNQLGKAGLSALDGSADQAENDLIDATASTINSLVNGWVSSRKSATSAPAPTIEPPVPAPEAEAVSKDNTGEQPGA